MCINYYKLDTKILMFDLDTPEQRFGIWVAKKEFGQRLKKELPLGQFYMSIRVVAKDLDISDMVVRRIIKLYISEGIISVVSISKSPKVASVYAYNTYLENNTVDNIVTTQYEHSNNTVEVSDNAGSEGTNNTVTTQYEHSNNTVDNTSKKKSKSKVKENNNIYSVFDYWNESKAGTNHKTIDNFETAINKAIKENGLDAVLKAIERLSKAVNSNYYYSYKWDLGKFLKQSNGISNWLDKGKLYKEYLNKKDNSKLPVNNDLEEIKSNYSFFNE